MGTDAPWHRMAADDPQTPHPGLTLRF
jgi:hypothetical protein